MKIASVYSICGEHTVIADGMVLRVCDADCPHHTDEDDCGEYQAYWGIAKIELWLRERAREAVFDVCDPDDGPQEQPLPIDQFFVRWREHVKTAR